MAQLTETEKTRVQQLADAFAVSEQQAIEMLRLEQGKIPRDRVEKLAR